MDKYGLIGYPLEHSFSKGYFNEKFQNEGIDAEYNNYEISSIESLLEIIDTNPELKGLNVTIPYKKQVIKYLDALSPEAKAIGAVNVIEPLLERYHKKALVLGTGGASKAVCYGLKSLGIETKCVSRRKNIDVLTYNDLSPKIIKEFNVIVNCTPVGMYPNVEECLPLPYEAMDSHKLLYDLLYNPNVTRFMEKGKEHGAVVKNGLEMLLLQAFASWDIWNDKEDK